MCSSRYCDELVRTSACCLAVEGVIGGKLLTDCMTVKALEAQWLFGISRCHFYVYLRISMWNDRGDYQAKHEAEQV